MPKEPWGTERAARQRAAEEARTGRSPLPRCPTCAFDETRPALRTELVQYYRCPRCGFVWSGPHTDADSTSKSA